MSLGFRSEIMVSDKSYTEIEEKEWLFYVSFYIKGAKVSAKTNFNLLGLTEDDAIDAGMNWIKNKLRKSRKTVYINDIALLKSEIVGYNVSVIQIQKPIIEKPTKKGFFERLIS